MLQYLRCISTFKLLLRGKYAKASTLLDIIRRKSDNIIAFLTQTCAMQICLRVISRYIARIGMIIELAI